MFSSNCSPACSRLKSVMIGKVATSPARLPIKASARTTSAERSRPAESRNRPKPMGIQIARLSHGNIAIASARGGRDVWPRQERKQRDTDADQHRECVVVDVSGLKPAHQ